MSMASLRMLCSRTLDLILRRRRDRRLAEELATHLQQLEDDYVAQGMPRGEARFAARRAFGGVDQVTAVYRDQRGLPLIDSLWQDVRFAARLLAKDRTFTAGAIVVLGLGLGVTTAVFTIINGMNFRGLPVSAPDQIVVVDSLELQGRRRGMSSSYRDFRDWQSSVRTFSGLAAYVPGGMNVGDSDRPADRLAGFFITANAFDVLGVSPLFGRGFRSDEDVPGGPPVAVLSHGVWLDRYNGDRGIVGRAIRINGTPTTVVGVMPDGFGFPRRADVWQPIGQLPGFATGTRTDRTFWVFGRLADRVSLAQAQAEMSAVAAALAAEYPETNTAIGTHVMPFTEFYVGPPTEGPPVLMMAAAFLVLLLACANTANLLLGRAAERGREIALRAALGASRARLVRQLLIENAMLASVGGVAGLVLSTGIVRAFAAEAVDLNLPYWITFDVDARVVVFAAALCLGTTLVFGLAPALQISRTHAHDALKDGGRGMTGGAGRRRWSNGLLIAELAMTMMLLTGAGALIRSALALYDADAIVSRPDVLTAQLAMPAAKYATADQRRAFHERLQEHLDSAPLLESAALTSARPFVDSVSQQLVLEGETPSVENRRIVQMVAVGDRYFDALDLKMIRGRTFTARDGLPGQDVVIINERFAALHFPGIDPIGRRIMLAELDPDTPPASWVTVVGVSPSVRQRPMGGAAAVAYLPLRAQPGPFTSVVLRGSGDLTAVAASFREQLRRVDADVAAYNLEPLQRLSEKSRWTPRVLSALLTLFALIATVLAAAGLYAMTAYSVAQRTSEIGIRMALGAARAQVLWLFLRTVAWQLAVALAIGLGGALAVGQLIRGVFVQSNPVDPLMLGGVVLMLVIVATAACLIPARRATQLDPAVTLRHE